MHEPENLKHLLVVGGGTAGWITAALLNRILGPLGCRITLVESANIATIGVGEATVPSLVRFVRVMGFDEDEFMRHTAATYKLGIKFTDWVRNDHSYWHPFGVCGGIIDKINLFHFWFMLRQAGGNVGSYASHSLQALLGDEGKAPRPAKGGSPIIESGAYAYHIDALALADFLKGVATKNGVSHIFDDVSHVVIGRDGVIANLLTESGRRLSADLFIDCTGFTGKLIEQGLGDPWIDWSNQLLSDRAVVLRLPPVAQMAPYTQAAAMPAGWIWQIPLSHRVGTGYVYSSRHQDDDGAAEALAARSGMLRAPGGEPRLLKMRVGRRRTFWLKNCVSVGLSAGFLEPLESTGIYLIQRAVELLLEYLPDRQFNDVLVRAYNARMAAIYDETRDFVLLHYLLSRRDDTAFWRDSRNVTPPDSLQNLLELYDEAGKIEPGRATLFGETSLYFILTGAGRLPRRLLITGTDTDPARIAKVLGQIRKQNKDLAATLPAHRWLMQHLHEDRS